MLFQTIPIDEFVDVDNVTGWDVASALAILVAAVVVSVVVKRIMRRWLASIVGLPEAAADALCRATGYLIILLGLIIALPLLGFDTQPVLVLILFLGVLVFFAGRPLMESFTAGLILQARSPFSVGELIQHGDFTGVVHEVNGRTTVIVTAAGETVVIPNVSMLKEPITNLSAEGARRTTVNVGVAYGTDLDEAVAVLAAAVSGLDTVLDDPPPTVGVAAYEDSAIRIQVWCWHLPTVMDEFDARDEIIRSIDRALASADIVIAFPQRDVWLRKPAPDISREEQL